MVPLLPVMITLVDQQTQTDVNTVETTGRAEASFPNLMPCNGVLRWKEEVEAQAPSALIQLVVCIRAVVDQSPFQDLCRRGSKHADPKIVEESMMIEGRAKSVLPSQPQSIQLNTADHSAEESSAAALHIEDERLKSFMQQEEELRSQRYLLLLEHQRVSELQNQLLRERESH
jgi:hypothetical protein